MLMYGVGYHQGIPFIQKVVLKVCFCSSYEGRKGWEVEVTTGPRDNTLLTFSRTWAAGYHTPAFFVRKLASDSGRCEESLRTARELDAVTCIRDIVERKEMRTQSATVL